MNPTRPLLVALCVASLLPLSCKSDPKATETATGEAPSTEKAKKPSRAKGELAAALKAEIPDNTLPTQEDFDEEVAAAITPETDLVGALDALEKEITQ